jgi:hypothetical protein
MERICELVSFNAVFHTHTHTHTHTLLGNTLKPKNLTLEDKALHCSLLAISSFLPLKTKFVFGSARRIQKVI